MIIMDPMVLIKVLAAPGISRLSPLELLLEPRIVRVLVVCRLGLMKRIPIGRVRVVQDLGVRRLVDPELPRRRERRLLPLSELLLDAPHVVREPEDSLYLLRELCVLRGLGGPAELRREGLGRLDAPCELGLERLELGFEMTAIVVRLLALLLAGDLGRAAAVGELLLPLLLPLFAAAAAVVVCSDVPQRV